MVIKTANEDHAGLDSDVYLKLFGSEGSTHEILLEKCGNRFERGTTDKFQVEFDGVGKIEKVRLRYDAEVCDILFFFLSSILILSFQRI